MSRRKRMLLWAVLLVVLAVSGTVAVRSATRRDHRITHENAEKLRAGMSLADVEALFGVPAGIHTAGDQWAFAFPMSEDNRRVKEAQRRGCTHLEWVGDDVGVEVFFEADGKVRAYDYLLPVRVRESLLERLCRWLGL